MNGGVLSDRDIIKRVSYSDKPINICPYREENVQPASYDVSISDTVYEFSSDSVISSDRHTFEPFERYLGSTLEEITLPDDVAAQIAGRSSIGRRGIIVHKTAGWVDPKFSCELTLEIMNLGSDPVSVESGERIAQLVFFPLTSPSSGYDGKYQEQSGPTKEVAVDGYN